MKLKALSAVIVCCLAFSSGCGKKIKSITDFSKYASMTRETDRIEVMYDNNSGSPFTLQSKNKRISGKLCRLFFLRLSKTWEKNFLPEIILIFLLSKANINIICTC